MRLRTRMALISASAVAVVVVLAVFLAQAVARDELLQAIDESLQTRAAEIQRFPPSAVELFIDEGSDGRRERRRFPSFGPNSPFGRGATGFDALFVQVIGPNGVAVPLDQPVVLPVEDEGVPYAGRRYAAPVLRTVEIDGDRIRMISAPFYDDLILQLGRSLEEVDDTLKGVTGRLTLAGAIGVALAGLLGLVVARSALRPVDDLTKTVEHVAETKELAARIDVERDDEVGRLAKSFNDMLEALEESRVQQQQLVRDAGHELRTPLTALRTNIELLARARNLGEEQRTELLDAATFELRELTDLTTELVDLAADAEATTELSETVQLDDLAGRVVERFRRRTGRDITLEASPSTVEVHVNAIERAIANLIDNADKWSPEGGTIDVSVQRRRVAVRDHGPGIDSADVPRVFDRFYRSDLARSTPGSGLGLAIVKKIVTAEGGEVFVEHPADGGVIVGFTLPAAT